MHHAVQVAGPDLLDVDVVRPVVSETTALGAAYAAGLAVGFWSDTDEIRSLWSEQARWSPGMGKTDRSHLVGRWSEAVDRSLGWVR